MVMNGFDTDGDGENNFYTVNGRSFYYARYPIRVKRSELVRDLPREPHRVRPHQLVPPARGLLPLPADGHGRPLGVHGHGDAVPGPARRHRDRVRRHRPAHVPRAPVRVRRARLDGLLRRGRADGSRGRQPTQPGRVNWRVWAVVPVLLLALAVGVGRHAPARRSSTSSAPTRRPPTSSTSAGSSSRRARSASSSGTRSATT